MKSITISIAAVCLLAPAWAGPSVKDLAVTEARKFDKDNNGRIEGTEGILLRDSYADNPKSWLYIFDDDGDRILKDAEISKIKFAPTPKPAPPKPVTKKPEVKKSDSKKHDPKKPDPKKTDPKKK
jgi:hypothetical protein